MSTRAIRALRGDATRLIPSTTAVVNEGENEDEDDTEEEESEEEISTRRRTAAFTMLNAEDSDDDDDEEEEESDEDDTDYKLNQLEDKNSENHETKPPKLKNAEDGDENDDKDDDFEPEDIDALLTEFQEKDLAGELRGDSGTDDHTGGGGDKNHHSPFDTLVARMDHRDFDYQYTMRTSLVQVSGPYSGGGVMDMESPPPTTTVRPKLTSHSNLFGPPMDDWVRPPRYVGGGMGMLSYADCHDGDAPRTPPWPYNANDPDATLPSASAHAPEPAPAAMSYHPKRWYTFQRSDKAKRDVQDYFTIQQSNGDINMLIMFIAHHPYVPEALLQLSNILYQTNHTAEGFAMLRRCLYTYESAFHVNFINHVMVQERIYLIDMYHRIENRAFFQALFRYVQISHIAGLNRTALATCRLLLSLDPLRDPMNVLLALDYHTIMVGRSYGYANQINLLNWMIRLVDDGSIPIWCKDNKIAASPKTYCGSLLDLPNWSYSYALALFELQKALQCVEDDDGSHAAQADAIKIAADSAIQKAMIRYPSIVIYLLNHLEIDTTGRSFQRDWVTVLDFATGHARELIRQWYSAVPDTIILSATIKACDLISKIFVEQNAKLYGDDDVQQWLYDNLAALKESKSTSATTTTDIPAPSPAILRYANVDPNDYSTKVQTLPPDANIIDNGLLAHAMIVDPRRPRYLRGNQRRGQRGGGNDDMENIQFDELGNPILPLPQQQQQRAATYFGPPSEAIDPDWPMAEVFLRSILPWNYVEGLPPPRR